MPSSIGTSDTQGLPEPADRRGLLREGRHVVPSGSPRTGRATTGASRCRTLIALFLVSWRRGAVQNRPPWFLQQPRTPPLRDEINRAATPGRTRSSGCGPGRTQGQTNTRQACSERPRQAMHLLKTYNSVWQTLWQTRLPALDHATDRVLYQPELLVCGGAPPESNPRPHPYHRCAVISRRHALPRTAVHA